MANFTPRTTSPVGTYNPFWQTNYYGASWENNWNTCIYGNPTQVGANVLSNCTGYAQGRSAEIWSEITGHTPAETNSHPFDMLNNDAGDWWSRAEQYGFETGYTPKLGAILVTSTHVAVIEEKVDDYTYNVSESGWETLPAFSYSPSLVYQNGSWKSLYVNQNVVKFIYNPYVTDSPTPPKKKKNFMIYLPNRNNRNLKRLY